MKHNFSLKCVQMDLARQIESMEYLRNFMDLPAGVGFTSVLLYLEDRIRTASYHL